MARGFNTIVGIASTDSIELGFNSHGTARSYSVWTYKTGGGDSGRVFEKRVAGAQVEVFLVNNSTTAYRYQITRATTAGIWDITAPALDVWHHIVILYNSSDTANDPLIYVDGLPVTTTEITGPPSGAVTTNTDNYVLGNRKNDNARAWSGYLAEFAVWDRFLTLNEINLLYNGLSADHFRAGLVEYVPLDGTVISKVRGPRQPITTGTLSQPHPKRIIPPARFRPYFLDQYDAATFQGPLMQTQGGAAMIGRACRGVYG